MEPISPDLDDVVVHENAYDEPIIDADFHLHIPTEKLLPYIRDHSVRRLVQKRGPPPFAGGQTTIRYAEAKGTAQSHDRVHGIAATSAEIREVADKLAIDVPIVQPGTNLELARSNYPTVTNALTRAYNDYVIDNVVDEPDDVYATMLLPNWDVDFAIEELERVGAEPGIAAAQNWMTTYKLWGDIEYDPIFETLEELDLNLVLHVTGENGLGPSLTSESVRTHTFALVSGLGYAAIANATNMIMTGVFDQFPDLSVSFQEAGTNWLPYVAYRLDEIYQSYPRDVALGERFVRNDEETLARRPSEYVFDNLYVSTQPTAYANIPNSSHVTGLLDACRAGETFMYTSDWPHLTLDPADWLYNTPHIDDELRGRILYENSAEFLRL